MMSIENNLAYQMQMLEISEIMPDKSDDNVDLGQLDFDENTIEEEFPGTKSQQLIQVQTQERRHTFRL